MRRLAASSAKIIECFRGARIEQISLRYPSLTEAVPLPFPLLSPSLDPFSLPCHVVMLCYEGYIERYITCPLRDEVSRDAKI